MRTREPDASGFVERDGVSVHYEVFGDRGPTVMLLPTWSIVPSGHWKLQVPYLARHQRVVTFDGRGSGLSDRPVGPAAYRDEEFAADAVAVLDAVGADRAVLVALSSGATWAVHLAAKHPDRVLGIVAIGPACAFNIRHPDRQVIDWLGVAETPGGWAKYNRRYWLEGGYDDFVQFFFGEMFPEPHSSKQIEDGVNWGREVDPATLVATNDAARHGGGGGVPESIEELCGRVRCPVSVIHGVADPIIPVAVGARLAELTGGSLVRIDGGGHGPHVRDPVFVNRLIAEFVESVAMREATAHP